MTRTVILGASSGPGATLFTRLASRDTDVIGIGRNQTKIAAVSKQFEAVNKGKKLRWAMLDVAADGEAFGEILRPASTVINCSKPFFVSNILEAAAGDIKRLITLGSTRLYTKFPDERAAYVKKAQEDALASGIPTTVLHPSLIYGGGDGNNIQRIIQIVRLFRFIPLPLGGRALIQPIFNDDVVNCIESALAKPETVGQVIDIAGPLPLTYGDFINACAEAAGYHATIISVPTRVAITLAAMTRILPVIPSIQEMEVRRLLEDKNFDISKMQTMLGVEPVSLKEGLRQMFARGDAY